MLLSEGADRVGGQLRGDKECPFSGVTKSGRVSRKAPESGARSVTESVFLLRRDLPLFSCQHDTYRYSALDICLAAERMSGRESGSIVF